MLPGSPENPFAAAASELGLEYGAPQERAAVRGALDLGRTMFWQQHIGGNLGSIGVRVTASGSRRYVTVFYGIRFAPLGFRLRLTRRRWWQYLFPPTVPTGSRSFDGAVRATSSDPERLARLLDPEARDTIVQLFELLPSARIVDGRIDGKDNSSVFRAPAAADIAATIRRMAEVADALAG